MIKCMGCMKDYPVQKEECPYCGYPKKKEDVGSSFQKPGTILSDRYIIGRAFHQDSVGISYIGWDNLIEKKVVIKEYFPDRIAFRIDGREVVSEPKWEKSYESGKKAFFREIEDWSYLEKMDQIARVYDQMMQYGTGYYIREYVNGKTIAQILEQENPVLFGQARSWTRQLIQILVQLQQNGLTHGNLSINNIVVTEEKMTLINFGIHLSDSKARGIFLEGNPYIPGELYEETELFWEKADVYAVAAIFYRLVTGEMPVFRDRKAKMEKIKSPSDLGIWMQPEIEKGLMNLLNGDPKRKEIKLRELEQIFGIKNQEIKSIEKKGGESKTYFLMILIGIEGVVAIVLAMILIWVW